MKYELVTLQVLANEIDAEDIKNDLEDWFYTHDIGMDWHSIQSKKLDTSELYQESID